MLTHKSLKSHIIDTLWELIISGEIQPNDALRENYLAEILQASRTPLREALQQLEWEGIVTSEPRKGFRLAPFSEREILEIYPLRAKLEPYALELSGIPSQTNIDTLIRINTKMSKARSSKKLIELDEEWHELLISNCTNRQLMKMIKVLRRQTQRYEHAYMGNQEQVEVSLAQHDRIINALLKKQLDQAAQVLAENMMVAVEILINSLNDKK